MTLTEKRSVSVIDDGAPITGIGVAHGMPLIGRSTSNARSVGMPLTGMRTSNTRSVGIRLIGMRTSKEIGDGAHLALIHISPNAWWNGAFPDLK